LITIAFLDQLELYCAASHKGYYESTATASAMLPIIQK
jgi:hypothetical protein